MENPNISFFIAGIGVLIASVVLWYIINLAIVDSFPQLHFEGYLLAIPAVILVVGVIIGIIAATMQ
jgi:hypothetical protein